MSDTPKTEDAVLTESTPFKLAMMYWHERAFAAEAELAAAKADLKTSGVLYWRERAEKAEAERDALREDAWQTIETAPKGGGAELVNDPAWVEPPIILLRFGDEAVSVARWDWYYAEGGGGYRNGFAWVEPCSGDPLDLHYTTPPTHWMNIPKPTPATDAARAK